jgi:hypothetical protein
MPAAKLLVLMLPSLLSLAGQGETQKRFCLVTSVLAVLLSFEPHRALLPAMVLWVTGMAIAVISLRERIHQLRAAGVRHLK